MMTADLGLEDADLGLEDADVDYITCVSRQVVAIKIFSSVSMDTLNGVNIRDLLAIINVRLP